MRTLIYEHAFLGAVIDVGFEVYCNTDNSEPAAPHTQPHQGASGLLHTCRQIRYEALPVFYINTTIDFVWLSEYEMLDTLRVLDPVLRMNMRSIRLDPDVAMIMGDLLRFNKMDERVAMAVGPIGLPYLEKVQVELGPANLSKCNKTLKKGFERGARIAFGKDDLIVHITTAETSDEAWRD
jgi:hypothetical protein